jgi:membrane-associated phospholipid phosphatase
MVARKLLFVFALLAVALPLRAEDGGGGSDREEGRKSQVEPGAGHWRTWVISSGADYRVPPPPGWSETRAELRMVAELVRHNDAQSRQQIAFWDAGAPAYRWIDLINSRLAAATPTTAYAQRVYAYVALAMYDATIAAWESKYHYKRPRPSELDDDIAPVVAVPNNPSYPSEHAAAAQAAATVLGYLLPLEASKFQQQAEEAGWSRVLAGLQYPSDYYAGLELGRKVAEVVIAQAKVDGSAIPWAGTVPTGPCKWKASKTPGGDIMPPGNAAAATWTPLLLDSPSEFRPAPPTECDAANFESEEHKPVRDYPRDVPGTPAIFVTNYKAFYWQSPEGLNTWVYRYADKWMFEDGLHQNPPRAARAYALIAGTQFDAFIASQDGKFTYWFIRPHQFDASIRPLIPVPYFPSYPSNHSTFSAARSEILAYLFPTRAEFARAVGKEGGDSRIWAGIHFPMDNASGVKLGKAVANVFIERAKNDGSQ